MGEFHRIPGTERHMSPGARHIGALPNELLLAIFSELLPLPHIPSLDGGRDEADRSVKRFTRRDTFHLAPEVAEITCKSVQAVCKRWKTLALPFLLYEVDMTSSIFEIQLPKQILHSDAFSQLAAEHIRILRGFVQIGAKTVQNQSAEAFCRTLSSATNLRYLTALAELSIPWLDITVFTSAHTLTHLCASLLPSDVCDTTVHLLNRLLNLEWLYLYDYQWHGGRLYPEALASAEWASIAASIPRLSLPRLLFHQIDLHRLHKTPLRHFLLHLSMNADLPFLTHLSARVLDRAPAVRTPIRLIQLFQSTLTALYLQDCDAEILRDIETLAPGIVHLSFHTHSGRSGEEVSPTSDVILHHANLRRLQLSPSEQLSHILLNIDRLALPNLETVHLDSMTWEDLRYYPHCISWALSLNEKGIPLLDACNSMYSDVGSASV